MADACASDAATCGLVSLNMKLKLTKEAVTRRNRRGRIAEQLNLVLAARVSDEKV